MITDLHNIFWAGLQLSRGTVVQIQRSQEF